MIRDLKNISLKQYNSFGIDVKADRLIEFTETAEIRDLLATDNSILAGKWAILGGGNNILFTEDYHGTLIHPSSHSIQITAEDSLFANVRVGAGADWDEFVEWCVERGLWGVENLSHIPSNVGAAPVQNMGAYGAEVKNVVVSLEMLSTDTLKEVTLSAEHCNFGYRDSVFKNVLRNKVIITAVNFRLSKTPAPDLEYGSIAAEVETLGGPTLHNIRTAVTKIRRNKLPDPSVLGNAGSFFKNPVVDKATADRLKEQFPEMPAYPEENGNGVKLSGAWLIDKAGWKGFRRGDAGVYEKQALFLVNYGNATGQEIIALAKDIQKDIKEKFGVAIEPEVNIW